MTVIEHDDVLRARIFDEKLPVCIFWISSYFPGYYFFYVEPSHLYPVDKQVAVEGVPQLFEIRKIDL